LAFKFITSNTANKNINNNNNILTLSLDAFLASLKQFHLDVTQTQKTETDWLPQRNSVIETTCG
jgi:hypothetical protein